MGKVKSHRSSLKMAAVIRKKAKAKRERIKKINKTKQFPKRSKKELIAPQKLPNREEIQKQIRESSGYARIFRKDAAAAAERQKMTPELRKQMIDSQINMLILERIDEAKSGYNGFNDALKTFNTFIEVIDARDPNATRIPEFEERVISEGKNLMIILNKIDLVPLEIVLSWIHNIRSTVKSTVAGAMLSDRDKSMNLLSSIISGDGVCVFGMKGVGKSVLCSYSQFTEIPSITCIKPTPHTALLGVTANPFTKLQYCRHIIERSFLSELSENLPTLCRLLKVSETDNSDDVINALSEMWHKKSRDVASQLIQMFESGEIRFYTAPPDIVSSNESEQQMSALEICVSLEISNHIPLKMGECSEIDHDILTS